MIQRKLFHKAFPSALRFFRLGCVNTFSSSPIKDDSDKPIIENATNESPKDGIKSPSSSEEVKHLLNESATFVDADDQNWATSPYPKGAVPDQKEEIKEPLDPLSCSIVLFPGQGTLQVGAIKKYLRFPNVKVLFEVANEILNYDLLKVCLDGPQSKLDETYYNQAATVVSSLAALERLREERPKVFENCAGTLGYSVGEITSLVFAGVMSFEDGIRLVSVRGKAMQDASDRIEQGMLSVYCLPSANLKAAYNDAKKFAQDSGIEDPVCQTAIYLYTQGKIIAGHEKALTFIQENADKYGLRKANRLPVSGAFHTPLMNPAVNSVSRMLRDIKIDQPRCDVYSNYTARAHTNLQFLKKNLVKQMISPVRWEQCIQAIYSRPPGERFPRTFDIGSQGRMKTLLKLINAKAWNFCIIV